MDYLGMIFITFQELLGGNRYNSLGLSRVIHTTFQGGPYNFSETIYV